MKVGAYVAGYAPEAGGGYTFEQDVLQALAESMERTEHRFCMLCARTAVSGVRELIAGKAEVLEVPTDGPLGRLRAALERESAAFRAHYRRPSGLDRAARAAGVDLLWFLGAGVHRTDLPYLTVVWDLQHRATPWFPEMSAGGLWDQRELAQAWFLQRAAAVVTGTRAGQQELERYYQIPRERTLLLPHPTPGFALRAADTMPDPQVPRRHGLEQPYLLYPAQLWPHKNHVNLLLALSIARRRHGLPVSLALVGSDKGSRAHLGRVAEAEGIADAVRFLGFVSRPDLVALYRHALALAYVSWCGPENLPPLEAFALGCPVIAGRITGAEEQLGEAALLVDPGDPESIAEGIRNLHGDRQLALRLAAAGRARAKRWTAEDYVRGVLAFFDRFEPIARCWPAGG